jgi:hypothetical protein
MKKTKKPRAKNESISHSIDPVAMDKPLKTPHKSIPRKLVSILEKNGLELFIDIDGEAFRVVTTESNNKPPENISPEVVSALEDLGLEIIDGVVTVIGDTGHELPVNSEISTSGVPQMPPITSTKSANDEDDD